VSRLRLLYVLAALVAVAAIASMLAVIAGPRPGTLLVLASAAAPDRLQVSRLQLHGSAGWGTLRGALAVTVPNAPDTVTLTEQQVEPGTHDRLRIGDVELPARIALTSGVVEPVLVAVSQGRPEAAGIYAGNDDVNLGLAELGGKKTPMPDFSLVDEQGRPFTKESVAGHDLVVAAFHTTCHETCPLYTGLFLQLEKKLPRSVLLAEVTTDPATDTPDRLRAYADEIDARWTFATGDASALAVFWQPFGVGLSNTDSHVSTLVLVDSHGYVQLVYRGVPDVGGRLPATLDAQLSATGRQELESRGEGWGATQVADALTTIDRLQPQASKGGGRAPGFTLSATDGRQVSMSDFGARPVVLNFWASYCPPCRQEMPLIDQTARDHPQVTFLFIDVRDDPGAAAKVLSRLGIRSQALLDPEGRTGAAYGVAALPTTVFIRADGSIEGRYVGATDPAVLESHLAAISA
jgi:cytochrome oxidase Cu insertion factor (SCO1/SenC/PrrC family)